jgi:hypothetical protein
LNCNRSASAAATVARRVACQLVAIAALVGLISACNESALSFLAPRNSAPVSDVLRREADCTLTLLRVQHSDSRVIASVPDYGGELRRLAGLGPGGGVFPSGCNEADAVRAGQAGIAVGLRGDGRHYGATLGTGGSHPGIAVYISDGSQPNPPGTTIPLVPPDATSSFAQFIAAADFDGDTLPDLAVSVQGFGPNGAVARLFVLRGDGQGGFSAAGDYPDPEGAVGVVAADFDGDTDIDLAVIGLSALDVRRNDGSGGFSSIGATISGAPAFALAAGRVDGNATIDLVAGNGAVLLGQGNGQFTLATTLDFGAQTSAIAIGDLDADGDADLATMRLADASDSTTQTVFVFDGNGNGQFTREDSGYATVDGRPALRVTELDGDAQADVYAGAFGAGLYGPARSGVGRSQVLLGLGAGRLDGPQAIVDSTRTLADFTGDGRPDVLATVGNGTLRVWPGTPDGRFTPGLSSPVPFNPGMNFQYDHLPVDLDTDGDIDLLAIAAESGGSTGQMRWQRVRNDGGGAFSSFGTSEVVSLGLFDPPRQRVVAAARIDAGTSVDVVGVGISRRPAGAITAQSTLFLRRGNGDGTLQAPEVLDATLGLAVAVLAFDAEGDGDNDLVVLDRGTTFETTAQVPGALYVYRNNGSGGFTRDPVLAAGTFPRAIAVGLLDGDALPDLVLTYDDAGAGTLRAFLAQAGGGWLAQSPVVVPENNLGALALGDFDGNGRLDAAIGTCCGNADAFRLPGDGSGGFAAPVEEPPWVSPTRLAALDLDADGRAELIQWTNSRTAVHRTPAADAVFANGFE